jgi:hypothetical protein
MRVNRTFSLDINTVQALKNKSNQSQFVDEAIVDKLYPANYDYRELSTQRLMSILRDREDLSDFVKRVINTELSK